MCPLTNRSGIYSSIPAGYPVLEETITLGSSTTDLESVPLAGGILVELLWLSIDPNIRERMRDPSIESADPGYQIGRPIWGFAVVQVVRSEMKGAKPGDFVRVAECPFQEYSVLPPNHPVTIVKEEKGIHLSVHLGILGMPGTEGIVYIWHQERVTNSIQETQSGRILLLPRGGNLLRRDEQDRAIHAGRTTPDQVGPVKVTGTATAKVVVNVGHSIVHPAATGEREDDFGPRTQSERASYTHA